jgi:hypothetical protein
MLLAESLEIFAELGRFDGSGMVHKRLFCISHLQNFPDPPNMRYGKRHDQ